MYISLLRATKSPIYIILIANEEGKNSHLHPIRHQHILIPCILRTCQDPTQTNTICPNHNTHNHTLTTTRLILPTRPRPRAGPNNIHQHAHQSSYTTRNAFTFLTSDTRPTHSSPKEHEWPISPSIQHTQQNELPQQPLTVI